jgi:hypothetical protein
MSKPNYTIRAERSGDWWALDVPELKGVHSQSKRLDQAPAMIEDVIELLYDRAPGTYDLKVEIVNGELRALIELLATARAAADAAATAARDKQIEVAAQLRDSGLPVRDIGRLLGVSHQRISQILSDAVEAAKARGRERV